jgi:UDP-2,4-diacetamido-2,4,6-trideoxy-beta-L-altropyranose hydrolase
VEGYEAGDDDLRGRHLLIRADSTTRIGAGHVMRCLALAQAWRSRGGEATFLGRYEGEGLRQRLVVAGVGLVALDLPHPDGSDLETTLRTLDRLTKGRAAAAPRPCLVLDGYHFDPGYQRCVRGAGFGLLVVDDNADLPHYDADVLLNQNIHAPRLSYHTAPETVRLLGTRYVLLRPEFLAWRRWRREVPLEARKVLVTLGGGDPDNVTLRVIEALGRLDLPGFEVRIVIGAANPHQEQLRRAADGSPHPIELRTAATDMAELMAWADVAVSAGGVTSWELAFMGLPQCAIVLAENQSQAARGLHDEGVSINLGWFQSVTPGRLARTLAELLGDEVRRREMSRRGRLLVDGMGVDRVVAATRNQSRIR